MHGRNVVNPTISVVVPALNEARNLEMILPQLDLTYEVVVVDGNSTDDTADVVARLRPDATFITQTRTGKGNALVCGFEAATGDIIVMLDADCSADPDEIPRFVEALRDGADFAKGSRFVDGGGSADITAFRSAGNWGLNRLTNLVIGARYSDLCYGYNAFWRDILPALSLPSPALVAGADGKLWGDGFEIETLLTYRVAAADLVVTEVPSYEYLRHHGASNLNAIGDGLRVLRTILTERSAVAESRRSRELIAVPATTPAPSASAQVGADHRPSRPAHDNVAGRRVRGVVERDHTPSQARR
ncbi:MAG: glycosyltransferase family 2 protein [Mobilicoccus sp.]|nr:glycosyltransferase family 2 protein [Mobilicoccus sp.]